MSRETYDTLSEAVNALNQQGFTEDFEAENNGIKALYSKKLFQPEDLKILQSFRFEGMTDPQDQSAIFAIEANEGTKGTLIISYSSEHNQNMELVQRIPNTNL